MTDHFKTKFIYEDILFLLYMEDSKKNAYIAGVIYSFIAIFSIFIAINVGRNMSGQFMSIVGLFFGVLGVGSFWKPESIGQIALQILENMQENSERQNKSYRKKNQKVNQVIHNYGTMTNAVGSQNTSTTVNNPKRARKNR